MAIWFDKFDLYGYLIAVNEFSIYNQIKVNIGGKTHV